MLQSYFCVRRGSTLLLASALLFAWQTVAEASCLNTCNGNNSYSCRTAYPSDCVIGGTD